MRGDSAGKVCGSSSSEVMGMVNERCLFCEV